jgi:hypothetical protein
MLTSSVSRNGQIHSVAHQEVIKTLARRRAAVERTKHVETMYILDLALDKRCAAVPTKPIPWDRFEPILKTMNLRCEPRFSEAKILPETVENRSRTV